MNRWVIQTMTHFLKNEAIHSTITAPTTAVTNWPTMYHGDGEIDTRLRLSGIPGVVVLDGLQGVRTARIEHRHGHDIVPRRVLRLYEAWRKHEHGNHRHYCYMYLVHFHFHGLL